MLNARSYEVPGHASSSLTNKGEAIPQFIPTVSMRVLEKFSKTGSVVRAGGDAMYTGELINELIEDVENAERKVFVKVTTAKKPTGSQLFHTYMYDFGREELIGVA
jgi:hypothetical protein